ncbi:MAG: DNA polymerase Y family protein [Aestuariibacter sp.]
MQKLWLFLHFPMLQLDALASQQKPSPTVILDARNNQILQLNKAAHQQGIQSGMGLGTASALSATLQVEPYNPDIESNKLTQIADSLYRLTSDIALAQPRGLLLRIHNMLRLYQGLDNYWRTIESALQQHQVTYQFATSHTSLGAKLLAETGWNQITDNSATSRQALLQCDLEYSALTNKAVQHLKRVGVRQIGDLAQLPLSEIARRFDIQVLTYIGRLLGELQHSVAFYHPEKQFQRRIELLYDITDSDKLLAPLKHLLESLEQFLKVREQISQELQITLIQRETTNINVTLSAAEGLYRAGHWFPLLALKLESIQLQAPVCAVAIRAQQVRPHEAPNPDLFQGKQSTLSYGQLIAILQAKLGDNAVNAVTLENDYRVEHSSRYISPGTHPEQSIKPQSNRPLFILPQPVHLTDKVSIVSGPERIEWGWWDKYPVFRDYFIARCSDGRWCWVFRTPEQHWYLQGYFS